MRLLVTGGSGYGNTVMTLPLLQVLHGMGHEVTLLLEPKWKDVTELFDNHPAIKAVLTNREGLAPEWDYVVQTIWRQQRSKLFPSVDEYKVDPEELKKGRHEIDVNLDAARKLGWKGDAPFPKLYASWDLRSDRPIVVCPGDVYACRANSFSVHQKTYGEERKSWPHWQELVGLLQSKDVPIVFLGHKEEGQPWMEKHECQMGTLSIGGARDLLASARLVISTDGGLAHIAAALGKPTIVLFGPTLESKSLPRGEGGKVKMVTNEKCGCRPCQYTKRWDPCKTWVCMSGLMPEVVLAEAREALCSPSSS